MKEEPLVSICIPTYNGSEYLEKAFASVNAQSYPNIEIIISDDNSTDNTLIIITEFSKNTQHKVKVLHHKPSGIGANWNNCIKHSQGVYIKFLFQDDVLRPECISKMVNYLNINKEVALVACKRKIIKDQEESWMKSWQLKYEDLQQNLDKKSIVGRSIFKHPNFIGDPYNKIGEPSAVLFKKSILNEIGHFRTDLDIILDIEFYYRILKVSKIGFLEEELIFFRLHSNQASKVNIGKHNSDLKIFQNLLIKNYFFLLNQKTQKDLLINLVKRIKK